MKTIKSLKDITALEVGDKVVFGDLEYKVHQEDGYYLQTSDYCNDIIFKNLNINKKEFVKNLGIEPLPINWDFPETKSLEALTAIVSALFKEYEKQKELPKTWEEFCERNPIQEGECFINSLSIIEIFDKGDRRDKDFDRDICISEQEAKAFIALKQLRQLRKAYVKNWEPNWNSNELVHSVGYNYFSNELVIESSIIWGNCMSFPTRKLANQFLTYFKDLLEVAKPLL